MMKTKTKKVKQKTKKKSFLNFFKNLQPMRVYGKIADPKKLILLFQILIFGLTLFSDEEGTVDLKGAILFLLLIILVYFSNTFIPKITKGDPYLFQVASVLFTIGVAMIYRLNSNLGIKQMMVFLVGMVVFYIVYFLLKSYKGWSKLTLLYLIGCFVLFGLTFVLGNRHMGAINWIKIGGFSFQPAEITKILFVFFIASYQVNDRFLDKLKKHKIYKYKEYFLLIIMYMIIGLFFIQRDLGMAMVMYGVFLVNQFIHGDDKKLIFINLGLAIIGAIAAYVLFVHIRVRVATWINPWKYISSQGYQITQSLFAISSGGFFGTGIGLGKPDLIPVVESDFIFSAICEEMGIFTGMAIIMLFLILVYRGFKISLEQRDPFYKYVAMGIASMFGFQAIIMFGGVLKLIPLTGLTTPFVSYGGSSMISSFICLGILQFCSSDVREKVE